VSEEVALKLDGGTLHGVGQTAYDRNGNEKS
jgi:hypothetical protein